MVNPILQQLNQNQMDMIMAPVKQLVNQLRTVSNPQAFLMNTLSQNPNVQQALQYIQQNGGDPKAALTKLAQEQGLDPEAIMNSIFNNK